ncbi:MAG: CRISPR-associated endonuclease Cas1 [Bacteroidota bacterium]
MQLVVDTFGATLGKHSERLVVREKGEVKQDLPFDEIEQITVSAHGVNLSSDAIQACCERGIQIHFLTWSGKAYAQLIAPNLTGTVVTRREQILAFQDERGLELSKAIVAAKLKNQAHLLRYFGKYRKEADPEAYALLDEESRAIERLAAAVRGLGGTCINDTRGELIGMEGRAAKHYWRGFERILADRITFPGREHRGASDPVNSMLNYGYGILYSQVAAAIILAGLEPFAGFIHVDRPGKASLVLDLVELFRQPVVDRTVLATIGRGIEIEMDGDRLADGTRKDLAARVLDRLEETERYQGRKLRLRSIIQCQARQVASYLRGDADFRPFIGGW